MDEEIEVCTADETSVPLLKNQMVFAIAKFYLAIILLHGINSNEIHLIIIYFGKTASSFDS